MRLTIREVAAAVSGTAHGAATIDGAAIDSRRVRPGELFVALVAERDGHEFIPAALEAGASAYLTSRPVDRRLGAAAVEVADTAAALLALGAEARRRLPGRVVGVTGSVGKTSTKDLLGSVLATTWTTAANEASFNNELGVPLTLVGAPEGTDAVVVEMGARGLGHIASLCETARPTVGVVTLVAGAHLDRFGDLATVARAKGELVEALPADGTAVLNADDDRVAAMAGRTAARVVTFGDRGEVRAEGVTLDRELRARFRLRTPWGDTDVQLGAHGRHQLTNALAAAAAGLALGVEVAAVAAGLGAASLSSLRMQLETAPSGLRILNDAYNANPTSMHAALEALAALDGLDKVAVLGTMAELGPDAAALHAEVAAHAASLGVRVVAVDEPTYGAGVEHVADVAAAAAALSTLGDGDVALVKASRVAALERLVALLHRSDTE